MLLNVRVYILLALLSLRLLKVTPILCTHKGSQSQSSYTNNNMIMDIVNVPNIHIRSLQNVFFFPILDHIGRCLELPYEMPL